MSLQGPSLLTRNSRPSASGNASVQNEMGVVIFCGSVIGGYPSDYTISMFGLVAGLQIVYLI